ncbi:hypothetical protein AM499_05540 [Bacillus sp. FJAT-22090]|uniref:hypothetical protein n=1 Tax=Bacillus sp. FJAT-22090 TaxID=1581038 RepID=UPI0006AEFAAB|nr:hypothetical protein [Bacillus sp. FJAT-22090]ALC85335.1 hypothetical protein AM499_05540 [Bacillus sp. FJAT-22090]
MKKWSKVIPILIVIIVLFIISGYRFTALSAAKGNSILSKDAELVEEYDIGKSTIFLFKSNNEEIFQTVLSEKFGLLHRSSVSTNVPFNADEIQTVGGFSFTGKNDAATLLSVISNDNEVVYIEAGVDPYIERKVIKKGERISFLFSFSKQLDSLNATAFNKEGKALYYYGLPKNVNQVHIPEDLKWYKIVD